MFITSWLIKNTTEEAVHTKQDADVFLKPLSKDAGQSADTIAVSDHQSTTRDSWTVYMEALSQEKHKSFDLDCIEARTHNGTGWPGVLPDIPEEEWIQPV